MGKVGKRAKRFILTLPMEIKMTPEKICVLVFFVLTYILIIALPKYKVWTTLGTAVAITITTMVSGKMNFMDLLTAIDYNVILMLVGIMFTVYFFAESQMPNKLADKMMTKMPNSLMAIIILCIISGVISAFLDNVATVLMLAPIALVICKKLEISPVPVIISVAVSSNLQGAATLVGDTTSVMLGAQANMSFFDFFFMDGKFSIFWAVEIGMLLTIPVLIILFRKYNKKLDYQSEDIKVKTIVPSILLIVNLALLVVSSFIEKKPAITNGIICMVIGIIALIFDSARYKTNAFTSTKKAVDFESIAFLALLFIIIQGVDKVGIIKDISNFFATLGSKNLFLLYTIIVFGSVIISAFIDNIPYVATMLPVIAGLLETLGPQYGTVLYFGLLCGATLGGNLTPFGASANIVGMGILKKEGHAVKVSDFFKIGIPFTLMAVLGGYAFIWLVWGMGV